jgi:hypothetical protein
VEADKRVTPKMFLEGQKEGSLQVNNAANRLRWMLKDTMGSEGAFERRAAELWLLTGHSSTDSDVVNSYRREVDPAAGEDAFMLDYLRNAEMVHVFGRTLFVHGAVNDANIGTIPGEAAPVANLLEWVSRLNSWARDEVRAFAEDPYTGGNSMARAGHALMDYGVPGGNGGRTVVYADFLENGNAVPVSTVVEQYLAQSGVTGVLAGHKPHGDCPNVIRSGGLTVITADISYSQFGHKSAWGVDNRGDHVCKPHHTNTRIYSVCLNIQLRECAHTQLTPAMTRTYLHDLGRERGPSLP